jgi:hypothetical protein
MLRIFLLLLPCELWKLRTDLCFQKKEMVTVLWQKLVIMIVQWNKFCPTMQLEELEKKLGQLRLLTSRPARIACSGFQKRDVSFGC